MMRALVYGMLVILLAALDGNGVARAADAMATDPDTAAQLAADLNAAPCQPFSTFSVSLRCQWQGQIRVAPVGDHYQAEVPEVVAFIGSGRQVALGTLLLELRPGPNGALDFSLALPAKLALTARDGTTEANVAVGSQTITGHWEPSAHSVTKLDASARDISLASPSTPDPIVIGTLALAESLAETQPGRWSGPASLTLGSLAVQTADGGELLQLGSATLDGQVTGLDIALALARRAQSQAAAAEPPALEAAPAQKGESVAKKGLTTTARHYLARVHDLFDGASLGIHLTDARVKIPMVETAITLGRFDYQTAVTGLEQGKSTLAVTYEHGPLAVTPAPALQDFLPKTARISRIASGLPNDDLWQALDHALPADGPGGDQAIKTLLAEVDAAMTKAGAHLTIETFNIDTPASTLNLTGQAQYDGAATMGMVAQCDMIIRGFDAALKALQPAPGSSALSDGTMNILSALTMLQVMGLPAKDETGRDARTYKVQVANTGGIMLNGADITILVQSLRDRLGHHSQPAGGAARQGGAN